MGRGSLACKQTKGTFKGKGNNSEKIQMMWRRRERGRQSMLVRMVREWNALREESVTFKGDWEESALQPHLPNYRDDELRWVAINEDSSSSWKEVELEKPKIKHHPDGKVIFSADLYGCLFDEDTVVASIKSMVGVADTLDIPFLQIFILQQPASERHTLCQYLYILMSLTQDKELLFAMRKCSPLHDLGWRPSVKELLTVFFNWGAPIYLLCDRTCKVTSQPDPVLKDGNPRITSDNIKLVLHHMESGLPHTLQEGEAVIDILFRTLFLLSLEKIFVTTFTRRFLLHCLSTLVDLIPGSLWNKEKVWHLSELAITGVEDQILDLLVICKKLFTLCSRCEEIGIHLAYRIVCRCFKNLVEMNDKVELTELPITVSHIAQFIVSNSHHSKKMDLFCFDVMVDMTYTVITKNQVSQDDKQKIAKYLDHMLNAIRENYKSCDVMAIREKMLRFSCLLNLQKKIL